MAEVMAAATAVTDNRLARRSPLLAALVKDRIFTQHRMGGTGAMVEKWMVRAPKEYTDSNRTTLIN